MPFWVYGRDSETGQETEQFFSEADDEDAARAEAVAQGLLVESIVRAEPTYDVNRPLTCFRCGRERVIVGRLRPPSSFHPAEVKLFRLSLDSPYVNLKHDNASLCVDCGLIWTTATGSGELIEKLRSWGRDELKERLGLSSDHGADA